MSTPAFALVLNSLYNYLMLNKLVKSIFLLLCLFFLSYKPTLAESEFSTDYAVDYLVQANGITHARFTITLINRLSNIYASEFSLSIGSTQLSAIQANNSNGPLNLTVNQGTKTTNIVIPFPDKVLGKDKAQTFNLEFESLDFANRLGNVWEISIPKLTHPENLNAYNLSLSIPNAFGRPAIISPLPVSQTPGATHTVYRFKTADLLEKGISATFGQSQFFNFNLTYHLANPNIFPARTNLALPPDTAFQKIILQTLLPPPESVSIDTDGNWLATYLLSSKQILTVTATGSAQIDLNPRQDFPKIELANPLSYLSKKPFWEIDNPRIIELAQKLKTPQNIYSYIVNNFLYDYGRLSDENTRFGAANALDNPNSVICMEFTDLFVALSRAANIPARAVNGFAYTTNPALRPLSLKKDVLHAWPEYFDNQRLIWVPVDPTWGNTTGGIDFFNHFDLNHLVFSIQGQDSSGPAPAGAYKTDQADSKDVQINFGTPINSLSQLNIVLKLPVTALAGVNIPGQIIVKNTGNVALYHQLINLTSNHFKLSPSSWEIPILPPFASDTIDFQLPATSWLDQFTDNLTVSSDLASLNQSMTVKPVYSLFFSKENLKYLGLILLSLGLMVVVIKLFYEKLHQD